ncbi:MAG: tetratricopeptide repeat protein, partial [bacterium]|nr:tetratricopeptide repeat protein [bacterium]
RGTGGSVEGYKKDNSGKTVLTRLDEVTLEKVARVTGGQFLPATREGLELKVLYREISGLEKQTIEGEFMERKIDRFGVFLALSFAFLLLEAVLSRRGSMRRLNKRRFLHSGVTGAFVVALLIYPHAVHAKGVDGGRVKSGNRYYDAQEYEKALHLYVQAYGDSTEAPDNVEGLLYNQANALHMMKRYEEALSQYHRAFSADDSLHAGRLLYNRGNTLLAMGKPDTAIESYLQALRYLPDDEEIRHNLEMALRMLQQQQQQQQQNEDSEPQDQEPQENREQQQDSDQNRHEDEEGEQTPRPDSTQANPPQEPDSTQMQQPDSLRTIQLTAEDALRLLRLLEEKEKQLQKEKRKAAFKQNLRGGKDW